MAKPRKTRRPQSREKMVAVRHDFEYRNQSAVDVFLIRESTEYDQRLVLGMGSKVLTPRFGSHPELVEVWELMPKLIARTPAGQTARALHGVTDFLSPTGRWAGWVMPAGPHYVIVAPASATVIGDDEQNAFTEAYCALLRTVQPRHVYTGPFSRQGRRVSLLALIKDALSDIQATFTCSEAQNLDLSNAASGGFIWGIMSAQSEQEWLNILERNFAGKVFSAADGRFPNGQRVLPLGLKKTTEGDDKGFVHPDLELWPVVNAMLVAASEETDPDLLVKRWEKIGVPRMRWDKRDEGRGQTIGSLSTDAKALVARRLAWIDTYSSGLLEVSMENPLPPGHTLTLHGIDLLRNDWEDETTSSGRIIIDVAVGLPKGTVTTAAGPVEVDGWADPNTFARIRANWAPTGWCGICRPCLSGDTDDCNRVTVKVRRGNDMLPLTALPPWIKGTYQYRIESRGSHYTVKRRPVASMSKAWSDSTATRVVTLRVNEAHQAVAELLVKPAVSVIVQGAATFSMSEISEVRTRVNELRATAAAARETAAAIEADAAASTGDDAQALRALAARRRSVADDTDREAGELELTLSIETPVAADATVNSFDLARLAALLRTSDRLSAMERRRLATMLNGTLRIDAVEGRPVAVLTADVTVPSTTTADGRPGQPYTFRATPVEVPNRSINETVGLSMADRHRDALGHLMSSDAQVDTIAEMFSWAPRTARIALFDELSKLIGSSGAVSALLECPIVETRAVVWESLTGQGSPVLADVDLAFAELVRMVYLSGELNWPPRWCSDTNQNRRRFMEYLRAHREDIGEGGVGPKELEEAGVVSLADIRLMRGLAQSDYPKVVTEVGEWKANRWGDTRRLDALRCPHCEAEGVLSWADHVLRVPEVWDAVLCRRCRRMPSRRAVFPAAYLSPWVKKAGDGDRSWSQPTIVEPLPIVAPRPRQFRGAA